MTPDQLATIEARATRTAAYPFADKLSREDVPALIAMVRDLEVKLDAAKSVLAEREEELMDLKGSCRAPSCILHYAHRGPCNRSALTATEGAE